MTWLKFIDDKEKECWVNLALIQVVAIKGDEVVLEYAVKHTVMHPAVARPFLAAFREAAVKP